MRNSASELNLPINLTKYEDDPAIILHSALSILTHNFKNKCSEIYLPTLQLKCQNKCKIQVTNLEYSRNPFTKKLTPDKYTCLECNEFCEG